MSTIRSETFTKIFEVKYFKDSKGIKYNAYVEANSVEDAIERIKQHHKGSLLSIESVSLVLPDVLCK